MRRLASSIVAAALILALTGCTSFPIPFACPAIGYSSAASIGLEGDSVAGWTATLLDSSAAMGYRVSDAAGAIVQEGILHVDWVRIDGTEQCGGNRHADVVIDV